MDQTMSRTKLCRGPNYVESPSFGVGKNINICNLWSLGPCSVKARGTKLRGRPTVASPYWQLMNDHNLVQNCPNGHFDLTAEILLDFEYFNEKNVRHLEKSLDFYFSFRPNILRLAKLFAPKPPKTATM